MKTKILIPISFYLFVTFFCFISLTPVYSKNKLLEGYYSTTPSGLKYKMISQGKGPKVVEGKEIALHGIGYFEDGSVFWNSRETNTPFYFVLGKDWVIKGCEEGVALMSAGDRYMFIMKPELGYGKKGKGDVIPPNATLIFDYEILSVLDPKPPISDVLYKEITEKGIQQAIQLYHNLKKKEAPNYNFREQQLNDLGYKLLKEGKKTEAIEIFKLNTLVFQKSSNAFDSLGDAYMQNEQKELAIKNFKKALDLNPKNSNAKEMIKKLQEK